MTPNNSSFIVDVEKGNDLYAVYEHHITTDPNEPPECIYVGCDKITALFRMSQARQNVEWINIFKRGGHVMIRIIQTGTNRGELQRYAVNHMRSMTPLPRCHRQGVMVRGARRVIERADDGRGEQFQTQSAVCEHYGLNQASLSRHLSGFTPHVGGMVFRWVAA